jgi:hypothetical protein
VTLVSDTLIIAVFIRDSFNLTLTVDPAAGGTPTGGGKHPCGESATITITENDCFVFDGWYDAETGFIFNSNKNTLVEMRRNRHLIAKFITDPFKLDLQPSPANGGLVNGKALWDSLCSCKDNVRIEATANTGFKFSR